MPVASAQVKSALLLAGLFAEGETVIHEPGPARDHTERMLRAFGVQLKAEGGVVSLSGGQVWRGLGGAAGDPRLKVPGDFSSAAFLLVAAAILPGSDVRLRDIGTNPTRTGLYDLLCEMGAGLELVAGDRSAGAG